MAEPSDIEVENEPLEEEPQGLPPEVRARREAALTHVRKWGDPVLRTEARPVEQFDEALQRQIQWMSHLMHEGLGIGLAATQIGDVNRVLVYRVQHESPIVALVNPVIEWSGPEEEVMEEGCLSLPGVAVDVERPIHVRVRAQDENGRPLTIEATGLEARVIQHETDHLHGVLILDRTTRDQRKQAIRTLREREEPAAAG